ncbi:hypothetical protein PSHT_03714, partial [Puccinia striiformis]
MFSSNQDERNDIQQLSEQIRNTNAEAEIDRNGEIDKEPSSQSQPVTIPSGTQTTPTVATAKGRKGKTVPRTITTRTQTAGKEKVATQLEGEATEATSCSPEIALPPEQHMVSKLRAEIEAPHPQIVKAEKQRGTARTPTERRETAMEMLLAKPKKKTTTKTPTDKTISPKQDQHPQPKTNPQRPTEAQQQTIAVTIKPSQSQAPGPGPIPQHHNNQNLPQRPNNGKRGGYEGKQYNPNYVNQRSNGQNGGKTGGGNDGQTGGSGNQYQD